MKVMNCWIKEIFNFNRN